MREKLKKGSAARAEFRLTAFLHATCLSLRKNRNALSPGTPGTFVVPARSSGRSRLIRNTPYISLNRSNPGSDFFFQAWVPTIH